MRTNSSGSKKNFCPHSKCRSKLEKRPVNGGNCASQDVVPGRVSSLTLLACGRPSAPHLQLKVNHASIPIGRCRRVRLSGVGWLGSSRLPSLATLWSWQQLGWKPLYPTRILWCRLPSRLCGSRCLLPGLQRSSYLRSTVPAEHAIRL